MSCFMLGHILGVCVVCTVALLACWFAFVFPGSFVLLFLGCVFGTLVRA